MAYLIDSDWLIDYLAGRPNAVTLLQRLSQEGIAVSVISYCEVLEGIYYGPQIMIYRRRFQTILHQADLVPLNRPILQRAARIRGQLRKTGQGIGDMDPLIAATALYHRLTLVTRNVRHFQRIPGLTLLDA